MIYLFLVLFFFPEAHVSTHIEEESLERIVPQAEYILLVEEMSTGSVTRKYKTRTYKLPEKKFRILETIKSGDKKLPEVISVTSERERKDAEIQIEYELTRLSKFPIYSRPEVKLWAKPDEKRKILFLSSDLTEDWGWIFISESFKEKIRSYMGPGA